MSAVTLRSVDLPIALGPLRVVFRTRDERWLAALAPRYAAFRTGDPRIDFEIELAPAEAPASREASFRLIAESASWSSTDTGSRLEAPSFRAEIDGDGRGRLEAPLHRHAVDVLCRALLASRADLGLLVHGALFEVGAGAVLCAGASGSGKTTLSRLFPEAALCDELAFLERTAAGAWIAHALPYWNGRPGSKCLAGIRLLRHGAENSKRRLSPKEALACLAREVQWPAAPEANARRAFELLIALVEEGPVDILSFRPTVEVWPLLAEEAA